MLSLQVFKAGTVFLEEAKRYGLADDDVLLQRLAEKRHATAGPGSNRTPQLFLWARLATSARSMRRPVGQFCP